MIAPPRRSSVWVSTPTFFSMTFSVLRQVLPPPQRHTGPLSDPTLPLVGRIKSFVGAIQGYYKSLLNDVTAPWLWFG